MVEEQTLTGEVALPLVNITGELVALGPLRRDLLPLYHRWVNDLATTRTWGSRPQPLSLERWLAWFEQVSVKDPDAFFTIYERSTWRPIGTTTLEEVDFHNRKATFGILIGESECRGKGYGTETARLMLDYAFTGLGLNNVWLTAFEYNLAGLRAYEKAGFREIGRRRQCHFMGGRLWDEVCMDCLASEFVSPVLARILVPDEPR